MKRGIAAALLLAFVGAVALVAYQTTAREREYRALVARGDGALRADQTFGAIEAYSGAIALKPDSMLARLRRGETYRRRGDLEAAARDLRMAANLDPSATRPLEELGDVLFALQRYERAAEAYAAYLQLDDRPAGLRYKLALARFRNGNLAAALAALNQAVRLNDRFADAYYLLGVCQRERKHDTEALAALERAVQLSPGLIGAREELADLYGSLGRRPDEIEQLQLLAGLDRDHPERLVAVGLAQARGGQAELAVLTLGSALERSPEQPMVYAALGRVWFDIAEARGDRVALNKAIEALQHVANNPTTGSEVLALYGRALLLTGDVESATRALQQATERSPIDPPSLVHYADAAERLNRLGEARAALLQYEALADEEHDPVPRALRIGDLSLRLNDVAVALEWLQRARTRAPNDVRVLGLLADAQNRAGDVITAKATLARALEREPRNPRLLGLQRRFR